MAVDRERLSERLAAVERRLTDADPDEDDGGLADIAAVEGRLSELESRADDLDARLGDVESGLQALRGYVGGVDAVDEAVERRANAALAKAERLEARLDEDGDTTVGEATADCGRAGEGTGSDRDGLAAERGHRREEPWEGHAPERHEDDGLHETGIDDGSLDGGDGSLDGGDGSLDGGDGSLDGGDGSLDGGDGSLDERDGSGSSDAGTDGRGDRNLVDRLRDAL